MGTLTCSFAAKMNKLPRHARDLFNWAGVSCPSSLRLDIGDTRSATLTTSSQRLEAWIRLLSCSRFRLLEPSHLGLTTLTRCDRRHAG